MFRFKSLKYFVRPVMVLTCAGCLFASAFGQSPVPGSPGTFRSSTGGDFNNPMAALSDSQTAATNQLLSGIAAGMQISAQMQNLRTAHAMRKIQSGTANTKVDTAGVSNFVARYLAKLSDPTEKAAAQKDLTALIAQFQTKMTQQGLNVNDAADVRTLAFVMSFEALHKTTAGKQRLEFMRQLFKKKLVSDVMFQGTTNSEKYDDYGFFAYCAMKARNVRDDKDAESVNLSPAARETRVKTFSAKVLDSLWQASADDVEATAAGFSSRGARLVREGKTTATFTRVPDSLAAADWNKNTYGAESTAYFAAALRRFDEHVIKLGGKTDDMAWANTAAFAIYYSILNDDKQLNAAQLKWVQDAMDGDVKAHTELHQLTDAGKQKYYENLGIEAVYILEDFQYNKKRMNNREDSFTGILDRSHGEKYHTEGLKKAAAKLQNIFQPRKLNEYQLTETGYVKK